MSKKILRERKDGGVSPCGASEDNIGKKKCCHLAVGAATIATVLGTSLFVYNAVQVDKSLDDIPVDNTPTTTEQLTTESTKKENVTSTQTHSLSRENKHTNKKIDYISGMPSSDYKKMKEASTTEVAKEDTTEETTETTTEVKKPTTESTTQAPANEPSTEAPTETPTTEQPTTETPTTEQPTTEQPTTEAPKEEPATEATTEAPVKHHHDGYCCYDCGYKTESLDDMARHSNENFHSYGSYSWDD